MSRMLGYRRKDRKSRYIQMYKQKLQSTLLPTRIQRIIMPTVRISEDSDRTLEEYQEYFGSEHGFTPNKKDLVEAAIKEEYK